MPPTELRLNVLYCTFMGLSIENCKKCKKIPLFLPDFVPAFPFLHEIFIFLRSPAACRACVERDAARQDEAGRDETGRADGRTGRTGRGEARRGGTSRRADEADEARRGERGRRGGTDGTRRGGMKYRPTPSGANSVRHPLRGRGIKGVGRRRGEYEVRTLIPNPVRGE